MKDIHGLSRTRASGITREKHLAPIAAFLASAALLALGACAHNTSISGRLPPPVIQKLVRARFGLFRACYEDGLRRNAELEGRVATRFVIERNGHVGQVSNAGSDLPDRAVVACVEKNFHGLVFPEPENGIVTVVYPIQFSPTREAADLLGRIVDPVCDGGCAEAGSAEGGP